MSGAQLARVTLRRIKASHDRSVAHTGDMDLAEVSKLLEDAMARPEARQPGFAFVLGEFIAFAVGGCVNDV